MEKLPFFYYDILSRITPGAATLATLFLLHDKMPASWRAFFVDGQENWKAVVVPLMLGGICYAIGVVFEALDNLIDQIFLATDDIAFSQAWVQIGEDRNRLDAYSRMEARRMRFKLWDKLVLKGGLETGMAMVFAHCHRFQAESKMFLHLIYPALLFAVFSIWTRRPCWWTIVDLAIVAPILGLLFHLRNKRRWLQTISFCKQLGLVR